jgi:hypothetical protein
MLDAWQSSGIEQPGSLSQLRAVAKDQRTIRRLMSREEQMKIRLSSR